MKNRKKKLLIAGMLTLLLISFAGCAGCAGCNVSVDTPELTLAPTATAVPTQDAEPTKEVIPTLAPTVAPVATPTDAPEITEEVVPTEIPSITEEVVPTTEPVPTEGPVPTVTPTAVPEPTATVVPTEAPTATPEPTNTSVPTVTPTQEPTPTPKPTATPKLTSTPKPTVTPTPVPVKGIVAGDYVTFGSYEQDNDLANGKEPIEWLVLETKDGKAFLLSKYVLDSDAYDTTFDEEKWMFDTSYSYRASWEKSTLRTWLNSEFYDAAFSDAEKESVLLTKVENTPNTLRGTSSGPDTEDWVYLLSDAEAIEYFGEEWVLITWENQKYWDVLINVHPEQTIQLGMPTAYALSKGKIQSGDARRWFVDYCKCWLRTTGGPSDYVVTVGFSGFLEQEGLQPGIKNIGIRPCLWIDLETAETEKVN